MGGCADSRHRYPVEVARRDATRRAHGRLADALPGRRGRRRAKERARNVTTRHVFIVSRDHPGLFEFLVREYRDHLDVEVILDRRIEERRRTKAAVAEDRRRGHRRSCSGVAVQLREHGYIILHLPADHGHPACAPPRDPDRPGHP
jgi:hypothetical protein